MPLNLLGSNSSGCNTSNANISQQLQQSFSSSNSFAYLLWDNELECNTSKETWKQTERIKTGPGLLILCLNLGVDPPGITKVPSFSNVQAWVGEDIALYRQHGMYSTSSMYDVDDKKERMKKIGENLIAQYSFWQPKLKLKTLLDPTVDELLRASLSIRELSSAGMSKNSTRKSKTHFSSGKVEKLLNIEATLKGLEYLKKDYTKKTYADTYPELNSDKKPYSKIELDKSPKVGLNSIKNSEQNTDQSLLPQATSTPKTRIFIHYNGQGMPVITAEGEIWIFNSTFTQYVPIPITRLLLTTGPSLWVVDSPWASRLIPSLTTGDSDVLMIGAGGGYPSQNGHPWMPADILTSILTTPIETALQWYSYRHGSLARDQNLNEVKTCSSAAYLTYDSAKRHPQTKTIIDPKENYTHKKVDIKSKKYSIPDQKAKVFHQGAKDLNWVLTALTDTIAWELFPRHIFKKLFRQDVLVAALFRNFLLALRMIGWENCGSELPCSIPPLPTEMIIRHPLWDLWDYTLFSLMLNDYSKNNVSSDSIHTHSLSHITNSIELEVSSLDRQNTHIKNLHDSPMLTKVPNDTRLDRCDSKTLNKCGSNPMNIAKRDQPSGFSLNSAPGFFFEVHLQEFNLWIRMMKMERTSLLFSYLFKQQKLVDDKTDTPSPGWWRWSWKGPIGGIPAVPPPPPPPPPPSLDLAKDRIELNQCQSTILSSSIGNSSSISQSRSYSTSSLGLSRTQFNAGTDPLICRLDAIRKNTLSYLSPLLPQSKYCRLMGTPNYSNYGTFCKGNNHSFSRDFIGNKNPAIFSKNLASIYHYPIAKNNLLPHINADSPILPSRERRRDPLPVLLQALLSPSLRLRALCSIKEYMEISDTCISEVLSVGLFPFIIRLTASLSITKSQSGLSDDMEISIEKISQTTDPSENLSMSTIYAYAPVLTRIWALLLKYDNALSEDMLGMVKPKGKIFQTLFASCSIYSFSNTNEKHSNITFNCEQHLGKTASPNTTLSSEISCSVGTPSIKSSPNSKYILNISNNSPNNHDFLLENIHIKDDPITVSFKKDDISNIWFCLLISIVHHKENCFCCLFISINKVKSDSFFLSLWILLSIIASECQHCLSNKDFISIHFKLLLNMSSTNVLIKSIITALRRLYHSSFEGSILLSNDEASNTSKLFSSKEVHSSGFGNDCQVIYSEATNVESLDQFSNSQRCLSTSSTNIDQNHEGCEYDHGNFGYKDNTCFLNDKKTNIPIKNKDGKINSSDNCISNNNYSPFLLSPLVQAYASDMQGLIILEKEATLRELINITTDLFFCIQIVE